MTGNTNFYLNRELLLTFATNMQHFHQHIPTFLHRLTDGFSRLPMVAVLAVLLLLYFSGTDLQENEENYLLWAKLFMQPEWLPNSSNIFGGHQVMYNFICGTFLRFFSFEQVAFWGRIILCVAMAFPLSKICKLLKINNLEFVGVFSFFYVYTQAFLADAWLFLGVEPKCFAYLFVLWSVSFLLEKRYWQTIIYAIIATWFHILVGGWWMFAVGLYLLFLRVNWKKIAQYAGIYIVGVLPIVAYVFSEIMVNKTPIPSDINLDWIYVYFRNPHHLAIAKNWDFFLQYSLRGVLSMAFWWLLGVGIIREAKDTTLQRLNSLVIILLSMLLCFVLVAIFDRTGVILKYYLFRLNALAKLLVCLLAIVWIKDIIAGNSKIKLLHIVLLVVLLPTLPKPIYRQIEHTFFTEKKTPKNAYQEVLDFIKTATPPSSVITFYQQKQGQYLDFPYDFIRQTQRDWFVSWKFVPGGSEALYEWYDRLEMRDAFNKNWDILPALRQKYRLDYILTQWKPLHKKGLEKVFDNGQYRLYKIK